MDNEFKLSDYGINDASNVEIEDALSTHVRNAFNTAVMHKRSVGVEALLLRNLRANKCEYQPDEVALLGPFNDVYMGIPALKARAAESWLTDIVLNNIDKPWTLDPTPEPELREEETNYAVDTLLAELPEIESIDALRDRARELKAASNQIAYARAEKATKRMETKIADQMAEGDWGKTFAGVIADIVAYPTTFARGPYLVGKSVGVWDGKKYTAQKKSVPVTRCISPFDAFPAPNASDPQDGDYFCERTRMSQAALYALIGVDGFSTANIRQAIGRHPRGYESDMFGDSERKRLEDKGTDYGLSTVREPSGNFETIIYNGLVRGEMLTKHGVLVKDKQNSYECEIWQIDNLVIRAVLNPNPTGVRPIQATSYRKVKGSIWGQSVICLTYDTGRVCNASARNLVRNMSYAGGPIGEVDSERVAETSDPTNIQPYKIVLVGPDLTGTGAAAYRFHNVQSIANELMAVFDKYMKIADDLSGVPSYVLGNPQVAGAGRTLGGLSMLMGNAAKGIKNVQLNIDRDIITGIVSGYFIYNMVTSDDDSIKADAKVIARGATGLLQRELAQTRTVELLQMLTPYIEQWETLPDGIKIMLREVLKSTGLPVDQIIPDPDRNAANQDMLRALGSKVRPGGQAQAMMTGTNTPPALPPQSQPNLPALSAPVPINMPQGA